MSSLDMVVTMYLYRWCPESLRWLMANGRVKETAKWIEAASKFNNVHVPPHILTKKFEYNIISKADGVAGQERITLAKYLGHCKLLLYTLIFVYIW